jgi:GDPmannose 4,6-dehydratase
MSSRTALITGITGQDGSYLAELLLAKGYRVCGLRQPGSDLGSIAHLAGRIELCDANLEDGATVAEVVRRFGPDECYHLAAQTFVRIEAAEEAGMLEVNTAGVHRVLAAIRAYRPGCRVFLAGSAEMFGAAGRSPQDETTPLSPRSFYGVTKTAAYHLLRYYRVVHGLHASCGILYNHESPRRRLKFVSRKIARAAALISAGEHQELRLGNLDSIRDWGHAQDYVRAMWLMMQQPEPDDYVIATGEGHTVREFLQTAFSIAGIDWQRYVLMDPALYRPLDPRPLIGDATKASMRLGWKPEIPFDALVREMVQAELQAHEISGTTNKS